MLKIGESNGKTLILSRSKTNVLILLILNSKQAVRSGEHKTSSKSICVIDKQENVLKVFHFDVALTLMVI